MKQSMLSWFVRAVFCVSLLLVACGDSSPAVSEDAGVASDMADVDLSRADAGGDAGPTEAETILGAAGGTLTLGELNLEIPQGAVGVETTLQVSVSDEDPGVDGVIPISRVYTFGPDGTDFATEAFVSFEVEFESGFSPMVYWTNEAGEFEPQATWWSGTTVHALVHHFSRGFVGLSDPPERVCCGEPTYGHGRCSSRRGVCLPTNSVVMTVDQERTAATDGISATLGEGATGSIEIRETPFRPRAFGHDSLGAVYDVGGTITAGTISGSGLVDICIDGTLTESEREHACLGFFDEETGAWRCQDVCLQANAGKLCGKTDHFTTFAILLSGAGRSVEGDPCGGVRL